MSVNVLVCHPFDIADQNGNELKGPQLLLHTSDPQAAIE